MPLQLRSWILIPRGISSGLSIKDPVTDPSGPPVRLSRDRIISDLIYSVAVKGVEKRLGQCRACESELQFVLRYD